MSKTISQGERQLFEAMKRNFKKRKQEKKKIWIEENQTQLKIMYPYFRDVTEYQMFLDVLWECSGYRMNYLV